MEEHFPSGRPARYFEAARKVAETSTCRDYRHGAVLVKGSKIISSCKNENRHVKFGRRFRRRDCGYATQHAELGCILGIDRTVTTGATLYVVRIGKAGDYRLSKPCDMCQQVIKHVGIKKVYYSINDKKYGTYRPE